MRDLGSSQPASEESESPDTTVSEAEDDVSATPSPVPAATDSPPGTPAPPESEEPEGDPHVLVVHTKASTYRLVRETLENFTNAAVETTPDSLQAFERALRRNYRLFIFGLSLDRLEGPFLYDLVTSAYANTGRWRLPPALILLREEDDPPPPAELTRDARVKDIITKPVSIERLLRAVDGVLERRDPIATK